MVTIPDIVREGLQSFAILMLAFGLLLMMWRNA